MICTPFTGHPVEGVLLCGTHMSLAHPAHHSVDFHCVLPHVLSLLLDFWIIVLRGPEGSLPCRAPFIGDLPGHQTAQRRQRTSEKWMANDGIAALGQVCHQLPGSPDMVHPKAGQPQKSEPESGASAFAPDKGGGEQPSPRLQNPPGFRQSLSG